MFFCLTAIMIRLFLGAWAPLVSLVLSASAVIFYLFIAAYQGRAENPGGSQRVPKTLFARYHQMVRESTNREELPHRVAGLLKDHYTVSNIYLYLCGCQDDFVCRATLDKESERKAPERILTSDPLVNQIKYSKEPLFLSALSDGVGEDNSWPGSRDRMRQCDAEVAIPLSVGEDLIGFVFFGASESGSAIMPDEIKRAAPLFAQMASEFQNIYLSEQVQHSQARLRRTDRLAMLGTLTAGLAHEIRNPLVSIKTYFQLLPERYDDHEFRERFQKVAAGEVERISRLVEDLLVFARPTNPKFQAVDTHELLAEVIILIESIAAQRGVELRQEFDGEGDAAIQCDPEQIKQVLLNITHNAFDAADGRGTLTFRTRSDKGPETSGFVHIEIEDSGVGMSEAEIEKLFTPFYTTKPSGTGLGLAISKQIIEEHLGSVSVESRPDKGSTFYLHLPKDPSAHERRKVRSQANRPDSREMVH
jgi:signal transduction histidine kinase